MLLCLLFQGIETGTKRAINGARGPDPLFVGVHSKWWSGNRELVSLYMDRYQPLGMRPFT